MCVTFVLVTFTFWLLVLLQSVSTMPQIERIYQEKVKSCGNAL